MKVYGNFFRKFGNKANAVPALLADLKEGSRAREFVQKLDSAEVLKICKEEADFEQAAKNTPEGKIAAFFNLQLLNLMDEAGFEALHDYIKNVKEGRKVRNDFYRGFHHGPCIVWAFNKDKAPEKFDGNRFLDFPTAVLYL